MKGFKYRFEVVLAQKKREEEKILKEMAPLLANLNKIQSRLDTFTQNLKILNQKRDDFIASTLSLNHFTGFSRYYREVIERDTLRRDQADEVLSPLRDKLKKAIASRKAFEVIRDKDLHKYKKEQQKKEQREMDNLSSAKRSEGHKGRLA